MKKQPPTQRGIHRIRFRGEEYILVGDGTEGAITTPEKYAKFETSVAHLFENGDILQFDQPIGTRDEIEWL